MILVIGDIIVDEFIWGDVHRISPEAPVPVVKVSHTDRRLGGSANVIRNLHALDQTCAMVGVVGNDEAGNWVQERLQTLGANHEGVICKANQRPTAQKSRVIARHQQVVRFDREWNQALAPQTHQRLLEHIEALLPRCQAVILSDYNKGVLTPDFLQQLMPVLKHHFVAIDPKPEHTDAYKHANIITPNLLEAAAMAHMDAVNQDEHVEYIARALHQKLHIDHILITRSERGMSLFDGDCCRHIATEARDVFDVTGAGDTVIATLSARILAGDDAWTAAQWANTAAGVVVAKVGTATACWQEIQEHRQA